MFAHVLMCCPHLRHARCTSCLKASPWEAALPSNLLCGIRQRLLLLLCCHPSCVMMRLPTHCFRLHHRARLSSFSLSCTSNMCKRNSS